MDPAGQAAQELVGDGTGPLGHGLDRQPLAPQQHGRADLRRRMAGEVEIELGHRIILSPFAAKRLTDLLQKLMAEYENRYGELK